MPPPPLRIVKRQVNKDQEQQQQPRPFPSHPTDITFTSSGDPYEATKHLLEGAELARNTWSSHAKQRALLRQQTKQELSQDAEWIDDQHHHNLQKHRKAIIRANDVANNVLVLTSNYDRISHIIDAAGITTGVVHTKHMKSTKNTMIQLPSEDTPDQGFTFGGVSSFRTVPLSKMQAGVFDIETEDSLVGQDCVDVETAAVLSMPGTTLLPYKATSSAQELAALFNTLDNNNLISMDFSPSPGLKESYDIIATPMSLSNRLRLHATKVALEKANTKNPKLFYASQSWSAKRLIMQSILTGNFDLNHVAALRCNLEWARKELSMVREQLQLRDRELIRQKSCNEALSKKHEKAAVIADNHQKQLLYLLETVKGAMMAVDDEIRKKDKKKKQREIDGESTDEEEREADLNHHKSIEKSTNLVKSIMLSPNATRRGVNPFQQLAEHQGGTLRNNNEVEDQQITTSSSTKKPNGPKPLDPPLDRYQVIILELEGLIHRARVGDLKLSDFSHSAWFHKRLITQLNEKIHKSQRMREWQQRQEKMENMIMEGHDCMSAIDQVFQVGDNATLRIHSILRQLNTENRAAILQGTRTSPFTESLIHDPCVEQVCPSCGLQFDPTLPDNCYVKLKVDKKKSKKKDTTRRTNASRRPSRVGAGSSRRQSMMAKSDEEDNDQERDPSTDSTSDESSEEGVGAVVQRLVSTVSDLHRDIEDKNHRILELDAKLITAQIERRKMEDELNMAKAQLGNLKNSREDMFCRAQDLEDRLKKFTDSVSVQYKQVMMLYPEEEHPTIADLVRRAMVTESELKRYTTKGIVSTENVGVQCGDDADEWGEDMEAEREKDALAELGDGELEVEDQPLFVPPAMKKDQVNTEEVQPEDNDEEEEEEEEDEEDPEGKKGLNHNDSVLSGPAPYRQQGFRISVGKDKKGKKKKKGEFNYELSGEVLVSPRSMASASSFRKPDDNASKKTGLTRLQQLFEMAKKGLKYENPDAHLPAFKVSHVAKVAETAPHEVVVVGSQGKGPSNQYLWRFVFRRPTTTVVPFAEDEARKDILDQEIMFRQNIQHLSKLSKAFMAKIRLLYEKSRVDAGYIDVCTEMTPRTMTAFMSGTQPANRGSIVDKLGGTLGFSEADLPSKPPPSALDDEKALEKKIKAHVFNFPGLVANAALISANVRAELAKTTSPSRGAEKSQTNPKIASSTATLPNAPNTAVPQAKRVLENNDVVSLPQLELPRTAGLKPNLVGRKPSASPHSDALPPGRRQKVQVDLEAIMDGTANVVLTTDVVPFQKDLGHKKSHGGAQRSKTVNVINPISSPRTTVNPKRTHTEKLQAAAKGKYVPITKSTILEVRTSEGDNDGDDEEEQQPRPRSLSQTQFHLSFRGGIPDLEASSRNNNNNNLAVRTKHGVVNLMSDMSKSFVHHVKEDRKQHALQ
eukprot:PhF_6_TR10392/c0_g1_i1/m.16245